ncbi:MAG: hypothetical protein ACRD6W_07710 [Nitrososphaerales archaeon]
MTRATQPVRLVGIAPIKKWAAARLNANSALRRVLETERESIPPDELVVKLAVWLQLLELEEN